LSSNSNSFPLNSNISEQQWSGCRGYYENWGPKILPMDSASHRREDRWMVLQKSIIGVQIIDACGQALRAKTKIGIILVDTTYFNWIELFYQILRFLTRPM
jgi:hypothetical protein